jgi:hypothetical protein
VQPVIGQGSTWAVCSEGSVSKAVLCL